MRLTIEESSRLDYDSGYVDGYKDGRTEGKRLLNLYIKEWKAEDEAKRLPNREG